MIKSILSVEDDTTTHLLNKLYLDEAKFCENYIEVLNGQLALNYFIDLAKQEDNLSKVPELILLDLNMPLMDGWEFLETFEKEFPQFAERTKIYILSSSINPMDKERVVREKTVCGFIEKPLDFEQIERLKKELGLV